MIRPMERTVEHCLEVCIVTAGALTVISIYTGKNCFRMVGPAVRAAVELAGVVLADIPALIAKVQRLL